MTLVDKSTEWTLALSALDPKFFDLHCTSHLVHFQQLPNVPRGIQRLQMIVISQLTLIY